MALFTESWTGSNGAAWPAAWTVTTPTGGTTDIQSNAGRQITGTTASQGPFGRYNLAAAVTDLDLYVTVTLTVASQYSLIDYRTDAVVANRATPNNGYAVYLDGGLVLALFGCAGGSPANLGSVALGVASVTIRFRVLVIGTRHRIKAWDPANPEPDTWDLDIIDATFASGVVGVGVEDTAATPSAVTWDNCSLTYPPQEVAPPAGLVQSLGASTSDTAATTTTLIHAGSVKPQKGDKVLIYGSRDNIVNDPATGDSFDDGQGNTYNRVALAQPAGTSTALAGVVGVLFESTLTTSWPAGSTTLTWTHPSTKAAMRVEHWQGLGVLRASATNGSAAGAPSAAATAARAGDTAIGMEAIEYSTAGTSTGDADTTNGSWSTLAGPTASTGTTLAAVKVISQYKVVTASGTQTFNPTHSVTASVDAVAILAIFAPPVGLPPRRSFMPAVQRAALW